MGHKELDVGVQPGPSGNLCMSKWKFFCFLFLTFPYYSPFSPSFMFVSFRECGMGWRLKGVLEVFLQTTVYCNSNTPLGTVWNLQILYGCIKHSSSCATRITCADRDISEAGMLRSLYGLLIIGWHLDTPVLLFSCASDFLRVDRLPPYIGTFT